MPNFIFLLSKENKTRTTKDIMDIVIINSFQTVIIVRKRLMKFRPSTQTSQSPFVNTLFSPEPGINSFKKEWSYNFYSCYVIKAAKKKKGNFFYLDWSHCLHTDLFQSRKGFPCNCNGVKRTTFKQQQAIRDRVGHLEWGSGQDSYH